MNAAALYRDNARRHAIRRFRERYAIALRLCDLAVVEERIRAGDRVILRTDTDGRLIVRVAVLFERPVVVFDPALDCIVTVLPQACREARPVACRRAASGGGNS